jgi:hypothetical protein
MERATRGCLMAVVCAGVVLGWWANDASAQATRVPISGTFFPWCAPAPNGGDCTAGQAFDADGVHFVNNGLTTFWFPEGLGDLVGRHYTTSYNHWKLETLIGEGHGNVVFDGCYRESCGTFDGKYRAQIFPSEVVPNQIALSVESQGQGTGDFQGMKRFLHVDCDYGPVTFELFPAFPITIFTLVCEYTGEILDPSGSLQP